MKLKVGLCGAGQFGTRFVPAFQRHPDVAEVYLADVMPDRLAREAARFGVAKTFDSLETLCRSDCDCVALFTQRWLKPRNEKNERPSVLFTGKKRATFEKQNGKDLTPTNKRGLRCYAELDFCSWEVALQAIVTFTLTNPGMLLRPKPASIIIEVQGVS